MLSGARRRGIVAQLISGEGRRIWAEIQAVPWLDGEKIVGVQGIIRDISARKRGGSAARRNNSRRSRKVSERDPELWRNAGVLRRLLDTTSGIGILHRERFQYGNERLARITGYTASELLGIDWRELFAEQPERDILDPLRLLPQTGLPQALESRWRCKDGTLMDVVFSAAPLATNADLSRADKVSLTVLDVTARKEAERQLRAACNERCFSIFCEIVKREES